jgi:hypothetical protein
VRLASRSGPIGRERESEHRTLLASLTCRFLVAPRDAWRELAEPSVEARLPSPALHGAALAGLMSALGAGVCACLPHALHTHFSAIVRCTLAAVGGGVGATALAVNLVPRLLRAAPVERPQLARYASAATLPLTAAGLAGLLPDLTASFCAISLLGLLAYRSGSIGAELHLGLLGSERTWAAALTSLVTTLPALLVLSLCAAR